jgi:hypothetical protein
MDYSENSKKKEEKKKEKNNFKWDADFDDGIDNIYVHGASIVD